MFEKKYTVGSPKKFAALFFLIVESSWSLTGKTFQVQKHQGLTESPQRKCQKEKKVYNSFLETLKITSI